jgi:hypothetical protein
MNLRTVLYAIARWLWYHGRIAGYNAEFTGNNGRYDRPHYGEHPVSILDCIGMRNCAKLTVFWKKVPACYLKDHEGNYVPRASNAVG